jgi:2-polyprenyl-6-methoxyphenol hydroxylase-like FAD-dependent oxidoreductase
MNDPILIAGGGPVGLMLACELGLAGADAIVLERLEQPSGRAPGMAINGAVVELLAQRGIMDALRGDGFEFPQAHFAHIWLDPAKLPGRHTLNFAVPHSAVERRLEERAEKLGVEIRRGAEVAGLEQDDSGVTVRVRSGEHEDVVRGAYLVGCDGADSSVRELAGIGFPGEQSPFRGILAELEVPQDSPLWTRLGVNQYDTGIATVAPAGPGVMRVATGEFDTEPAHPKAPASFPELAAAFWRITGTELAGTPRWLSRWRNATRLAERYRAGRVLLAGDAAHVFFPLGGQALSTGIEDAVNLGWKLAAEVRGAAPDGLLDTYHAERHPVGVRACSTTRAQTALMHPMARVAPLRNLFGELVGFDPVNTYLVRLVGGLDVRYPMGDQDPLLGTRPADIPLTTPAGDTSVARLLEPGHAVLLDLGSADGLRDATAGWADRLDVVSADPTRHLAATAVLLRPDGRVAWTSTCGGTESLTEALRTWLGTAVD